MQLCEDKYHFQLSCEPYLLKPNTPPEGEAKPELPPGKPRWDSFYLHHIIYICQLVYHVFSAV